MMPEKPGSLEEKIIIYLAKYPERSKKTISEYLGYNKVGQVNKQVDNLKEKNMLKSFSTYKIKGRDVDLWGLDHQGMGQYLIFTDYSTKNACDMFNVYKGYDPVAGCWVAIIKGLEDELGPDNEVVGVFLRHGATLLATGIPTEDLFYMLRGYLTSKLSKVQLKRVYDKIEIYARNWRKNSLVF